MYQNIGQPEAKAKYPVECCSWITLMLSAVLAWDLAPEYNFAISIFGLVAVRSADARLISYMALIVPLLFFADVVFFFVGDYSGLFSFIILICLTVMKAFWSFFAMKLVKETNGTYLAFLDCVRGTVQWFKGMPSGHQLPMEPAKTDSYQQN